MKPNETKRFAIQARKTLERAQRYRKEAEGKDLDEIDRERLLAAARAIEIDGHEWVQLARELAS